MNHDCPNCLHVNGVESRFCASCGFPLPQSGNLRTKVATPHQWMSDAAQPRQVMPLPHNPNLFPCPDCKHACSKAAASCPQCGRPFAAPPPRQQSPPTQPLYPVVTHANPHSAPPQVHYHHYPQPFHQQQLWTPGVAALLSFLIPGAGQLYKGNVGSGLVWFFVVILGYVMLILPGLLLHVICIVAAASGDPYRRGG